MTWSLRLHSTVLLFLIAFSAYSQEATPTAISNVVVALSSNLYGRTENGVPVGIAAEAVTEILRRMGYAYTLANIGSEGVVAAFKEGRVDIIATLRKTTKYKDIGLFTDPIIKEYNVIAVREGEEFSLTTAADLQGKTLGIRAANEYKPPTQYADITMQKFETKGDILRALILKKTDASIISSLADMYDFRTEGVMNQIDILDRAINFISMCSVFSKRMFTQQDVDNFNTHLKALQQEPMWAEILSRNGFGDLMRDWELIGE